MGKIEVYVYEDEKDLKNLNKVHIGNIIVDREGRLELSILVEGETASELRKAFDDIRSRKTLKRKIEEIEEIEGKQVLVLKGIDVQPGSPHYIWAVAHALKLNGFICNVVVED